MCKAPLALAQSRLSTALYGQVVALENVGEHDAAQELANRSVVISKQALADLEIPFLRSEVRTNLSVCYQILGRMAQSEDILLDSLDEVEGEMASVTLNRLSELHRRVGGDKGRGLAYARQSLKLCVKGDYKRPQMNALYQCAAYLRLLASDTGDFEEFYSVIEDLCLLCRSLEGGKL